ncbi:hypothetical protein ACSSS7_004119 [Eimeria intestinalis]
MGKQSFAFVQVALHFCITIHVERGVVAPSGGGSNVAFVSVTDLGSVGRAYARLTRYSEMRLASWSGHTGSTSVRGGTALRLPNMANAAVETRLVQGLLEAAGNLHFLCRFLRIAERRKQ